MGANATSDGLLNVLGGGVTRLGTPTFPIPLFNLYFALSLLSYTETFQGSHTLIVSFTDADNKEVSRATANFSAIAPPERALITASLVLPLSGVVLPAAGPYDIPVDLDGRRIADLFLFARQQDAEDADDTETP
jgi:hypothetical protein